MDVSHKIYFIKVFLIWFTVDNLIIDFNDYKKQYFEILIQFKIKDINNTKINNH